MSGNDSLFMQKAVELSESAVRSGNEPFGAVLVKDGEIVYSNENQIYTMHDPTFHAEAGLIRRFCAETGITDLREVYGASNTDLEEILGNEGCNCSKMVFDNSFWQPEVTSGILREEALKVLKEYFGNHQKG